MTENEALIKNAQIEDLAAEPPVDAAQQQIIALRELLKLPYSQRNTLLAQQAATIAEYFLPGSEEMEWAEKYVEDDITDDE